MNNSRVTLLREILVTQLNHWALFPIVLILVYLVNNKEGITGCKVEFPNMWIWLLCSLIPFALYLTRQYIQNFFLAVGLHVFVVVACTFFPGNDLLSHVLYVGCSILYVVYSLRLRLRNENMEDDSMLPVVAILINGAALYLYHYMGGYDWDNHYVLLLIVVLALYFLNYYIEQYQNFLLVNESSAGVIPARDIFRSGMGMVLAYTALMIGVLSLTANVEWLGKLLNYMKQLLKKLLRSLFNIYPEQSSFEQTQQEIVSGGIPIPEYVEEPSWAWIWDVLMAITCIVAVIVLIGLIIYSMRRMIDYIRKNWSTVYQRKNAKEYVVYEVREKCEIVRSANNGRKGPFVLLSPNERVRRTYKKQILAARKRNNSQEEIAQLSLCTARDLGKRFGLNDSTRIYEKARYSCEECDMTDVKNIKLLGKM